MTYELRVFLSTVLCLWCIPSTKCTTFILQAEEYIDFGKNHQVKSKEDGSRTLFVPSRQVAIFRFCLSKDSKVALEDVVMTTKIPLSYFIDDKEVSLNQCANQSTCFKFGQDVHLFAGQHFIKIQNTKASQLLNFEIDFLKMTVDDASLQLDVFRCKIFCFEESGKQTFEHRGNTNLRKATVHNLSQKTTCAEVDNIKVPILHLLAKTIEVKATHPGYKTFHNFRTADWRNCKIDNRILWRVQNATLKNALFYGDKFSMSEDENNNQHAYTIKFFLDGMDQDSVDSEIGTVLTLELQSVKGDFDISMSYFGRKETWIQGGRKRYSSFTQNVTWDIPDFTFSDKIENKVSLIFQPINENLVIKLLMLKKRIIDWDKRFPMYSGNGVAVEGVHLDFWWLQNQTMSVRIMETNKTYYTAQYIVIYTLKPWSKDDWAQVLVLYQDGNVRMLPVTQEGTDWIPFGSSVIIGESDPTTKRPHASISHIDIYADSSPLVMEIQYLNGDRLSMQVLPEFDATTLILKDINFMYELPLLTFRSMYVKDGNCDVDHLLVDGDKEVNILSDWDVLAGTSFMFYRKCISHHNTQSPDISVFFIE